MAAIHENDARQNPYAPSTPVAHSHFNPVSPFFNTYDRFARWRADLGLPQPGTVENLQKEVKGSVLGFSSGFTLQSKSPFSYTSVELHIRWCPCRLDEESVYESVVPSHPFFRTRITNPSFFIQLWCHFCQRTGM